MGRLFSRVLCSHSVRGLYHTESSVVRYNVIGNLVVYLYGGGVMHANMLRPFFLRVSYTVMTIQDM